MGNKVYKHKIYLLRRTRIRIEVEIVLPDCALIICEATLDETPANDINAKAFNILIVLLSKC